ncbi:B box and SPRY domain-containing protein isoform X2 [Dendropsophus ebraccatus]|uniref:B box and SPRY domain-containing protein isoform X2 n=1 Tax=Dendropsophus ebraccatus TaxID=150705 RepID=UPI003831CDBE
MSYPGSSPGDPQPPLWMITGSHSWGGSGKLDALQAADRHRKSPFAEEWIPDGHLATLSLETSNVETIDLEDHPSLDETPGRIDVQQGPVDYSVSDSCRVHGQELSLFCYQEHKLICAQCKSLGTCQSHRTKPVEERASQIRSTARSARELIIQRLNFIRNVCDNEEQRLLEEIHAEEERAQQGILTQRAHWTESTKKLSGIRNYLVDMLTKMDDLNLIVSENKMEDRTEEAEGILEPKESEKLNFNMNCCQSPLLNRLWALSVLCCTTACENLTFDERTLSPLLAISDNSLKFLPKKAKDYPDGPERFDHWPNCLAAESFQKGIHMWKVNVETCCAYKLGITYRSIARKGSGNDARLGYNPVSWIFSRYDKDFRFSYDSKHELVELLKSPKQLGILVDMEAGELIFFDPSSCVILYSHQTRFSAPVSPVFAVADDCIKLEK